MLSPLLLIRQQLSDPSRSTVLPARGEAISPTLVPDQCPLAIPLIFLRLSTSPELRQPLQGAFSPRKHPIQRSTHIPKREPCPREQPHTRDYLSLQGAWPTKPFPNNPSRYSKGDTRCHLLSENLLPGWGCGLGKLQGYDGAQCGVNS